MDYDRDYFHGKTAVVTGGASGIGLALLEKMLQSGTAKVVMADINQGRLDEEGARLEKQFPGKVKPMRCDVTQEADVHRMIAEAVDFFGGQLDLLFNNAGFGASGWFKDLNNDDWKAAFDLNFYGALYGIHAALPIMEKQGGGQIINTISGIAFAPMPYQTRYTATKAALCTLSLALRAEYAESGIKISPATPGTTATHIFDGVEIPKEAQSARQSAQRILAGVANNDRIIFGSDDDMNGGKWGFSYEAGPENDKYYLRVARERREGKLVF